jgi:hypothetical protein
LLREKAVGYLLPSGPAKKIIAPLQLFAKNKVS